MFQSRNGDRDGVQNQAVIITDGKANNREDAWQEAMRARQAGINVITVGVGGGVSEVELKGMASYPTDANVVLADDFDSLESVMSQLSRGLCNGE